MSRIPGPWQILGIERTRDAREIRRAYAGKLKLTNPEDDPEGFKQLRAAYELALQYSAHAPQRVAKLPEPVELVAVVEAAPAEPRPAIEVDHALLAQQSAIAAIANALRGRKQSLDGSQVQALLSQALDPGRLERFDLHQRTEAELGELLARHIPRSDPFLAQVEATFEWAKRQDDRHLPAFARAIVNRLSDLWYLENLQQAKGAEGRAFARLSLPASRAERWGHAYLNLLGEWPELELIRRLEMDHPKLLSTVLPENLAWWRQFESHPRFSLSTALFGMLVSFIAMLALFPAPRANGAYLLLPVGGLAVAMFRLFAVDWPVHLVQRRWHGATPAWFTLGWLPASILLLFAALPAVTVPWLAWLIAALACSAAMWAVIAGGPVRPVISPGALVFANARLSRILITNLFALIWLTVTVNGSPAAFSWPLLVTIGAAMGASAVGRQQQVVAFGKLPAKTQMLACLAAAALAFLLGYAVIRFGMQVAWQTPLIIAVLSLMLLRRAAPMDLQLPQLNWNAYWIGGILLVNLVRVLSDVDFTAGVKTDAGDGSLVVTTILMLLGVVAATLQYAFLLRRETRP